MTKQEFEKLTDLKVDMDQFEVINDMYLYNENQTKQEFCRWFAEASQIGHVNAVVRMKKKIEKLRVELYQVKTQRDMWEEYYVSRQNELVELRCKLEQITNIVKGGE